MVIVEPAAIIDAAAILDLQKLCYQGEAALYGDLHIPPLTETEQDLRSEFAGRVFLKAVDNGVIVGSVRAHVDKGTCLIGRLFVHPDLQNRGIGTKLMREIEKRFPLADRYELFTGDKSKKNIRLYRKLGYREFRREPVSPRLALVYMEKEAR
jgi:GNAT superfamily N-acetyltransferase